jgi:succinoglycan biosynthesis protein ExoM
MPNQKVNISVCICTFKRPAMLERAIEGVIRQINKGFFTLEIIVVDNDRYKSAEYVVKMLKENSDIDIKYDYFTYPEHINGKEPMLTES